MRRPASVAVVGAGIIGLATARELGNRFRGITVTVFDKEGQVAEHQSGHNSGVVHAGLYYTPGSLKAILCRRGGTLLRAFCEEHEIPYAAVGKLVVATSATQLPGLAAIEARSRQNGVPDVRRLDGHDIAGLEPYARGVAALHSPHTAAVDYRVVCRALAGEVERHGGQVLLGSEVTGVTERSDGVHVDVGDERRRFDRLIVCAGVHGDRFARLAGRTDALRIVPFRGEYYELRPEASHRVRGMIYPVPDPRYPFLGVHLTRDVHGRVHVGPNAVLALALEGYRRRDVEWAQLARTVSWPGIRRLAVRHWRAGISELTSSLFTRRFLRAVRRYLPDLEASDLVRSDAGVRAQAVDRSGRLVDDFVVQRTGRIVLVRNAPSPAASSSLAIAEHIAASVSELSPVR